LCFSDASKSVAVSSDCGIVVLVTDVRTAFRAARNGRFFMPIAQARGAKKSNYFISLKTLRAAAFGRVRTPRAEVSRPSSG